MSDVYWAVGFVILAFMHDLAEVIVDFYVIFFGHFIGDNGNCVLRWIGENLKTVVKIIIF